MAHQKIIAEVDIVVLSTGLEQDAGIYRRQEREGANRSLIMNVVDVLNEEIDLGDAVPIWRDSEDPGFAAWEDSSQSQDQ